MLQRSVFCVLVAVAAVCAFPVMEDGQALLEEDKSVMPVAHAVQAVWQVKADSSADVQAPPKTTAAPKVKKTAEVDHSSHHVAAAVHHVWKHDTSWLKAKWAKDMKSSNWHCTHCHKQCKTNHCRAWCHKKFCGPQVKTGKPLPKVVSHSGESKPVLEAAHKANVHLEVAKSATEMSKLRKADRSVDDFQQVQEEDMAHFKRQIVREDDLDKAAYDSRTVRRIKRKERRAAQKLVRKSSKQRARANILKDFKHMAQDKAYMAKVKTENAVNKAMSSGLWYKSMLTSKAAISKPKHLPSSKHNGNIEAKVAAMQESVKHIQSQVDSSD
jgi:hypothetical protein